MTVPNFYKLGTSRYYLSGYNAKIDYPLEISEGNLIRSRSTLTTSSPAKIGRRIHPTVPSMSKKKLPHHR